MWRRNIHCRFSNPQSLSEKGSRVGFLFKDVYEDKKKIILLFFKR